jgi:hypothetical protein
VFEREARILNECFMRWRTSRRIPRPDYNMTREDGCTTADDFGIGHAEIWTCSRSMRHEEG